MKCSIASSKSMRPSTIFNFVPIYIGGSIAYMLFVEKFFSVIRFTALIPQADEKAMVPN